MTTPQVLTAAFAAGVLAQLLKLLTHYIRYKKMNFRPMVSSGGMPSSHSSLVVSLATGVGLVDGFDSTTFAIACIFAFIVMYDASGVRQAAGKQARVLNKIVDELNKTSRVSEERLKELLGHTPLEVIAGAALGIIVAFILITP